MLKEAHGHKASFTGAVEVQETTVTIPTYIMNDDDPYPRFDEWKRGAPVYPYPLKNSGTWKKQDKRYIALVMENEYLKVVVLPELGGHLYQMYDKVNDRDIIYTNHVVKPGYFAVRGGWISGGFEFNFPMAHSTTTISPIDYTIRKNPDGSASIFIGNVERQYRMRWQVALTLYPGKSFLQQDTRLYNRTPLPHRFHWWTIVAMHPNDDTQVIFPAARVINHPQEYILTWPMWRGLDNSRYKTLLHRFGSDWSMLKPWDGFFCYYDHGVDAGLVHVGNKHTIGGTKYFSYCNTTSGRFHSGFIMSDEDGPYDEIDSSPFLTQHDYKILEPFEVEHYKEYWYAVNGIGGLVKATRDAALNVYKVGSRVKVALNVNFPLYGGRLIVKAGGKAILEESVSLAPGRVYRREVEAHAGVLSASLSTLDGEEVISFTEPFIDESKLPPEGPVVQKEKDVNKMSVEEVCMAGMFDLQHEMLDKAVEWFKAALDKDPGCTFAHNQLGIIYLKRGLWREAESEFQASLARERHQGIPHYYLGLIHRFIGNISQAVEHFWESVKYFDTYFRGYHCLGEVALAQGNFSEAEQCFSNALSRNMDAMETWGLLSVAYRKLRHFDKAKVLNATILYKEPINHLAAFETYQVAKETGGNEREMREAFLKLMRDEDHSYAELAWVYASCGLYHEAIEVLETIAERKGQKLFPMLYYQLGYLYEQLGEGEEAVRSYEKASSAADWRYVFPNSLEELLVLERVVKQRQDDYCARYALGNFLASRYRYKEAIQEFRVAVEKAEGESEAERQQRRHVLTTLYRNLAFLLWKTERKGDEAAGYYRKALQYGEEHFACYQELAELYEELKETSQAISVLESGLSKVLDPAELILRLAPLYMKGGMFDKLVEVASRYKYDAWKGLEIQRWVRKALLYKGKSYFEAGEFAKALSEFEKATTVCPESIPVQGRLAPELSEVLWWKGCTYDKLGRVNDAKRAWAEAESERHEPISPLSFYQAKCLQAIGKNAEAGEILDRMHFFGTMYATQYPLSEPDRNSRLGAYTYLQALAYEGKGMIEKARMLYRKALELVPGHKEAEERLQAEALAK